jgi:trimeric autotransporter adhesin
LQSNDCHFGPRTAIACDCAGHTFSQKTFDSKERHMFCQQSPRTISSTLFARPAARIRLLTLTLLAVSLLAIPKPALSQTQTATAASVPRLIRYAGVARDLSGNPHTGTVGVTFSLYGEKTGGAALWMETQNVQADASGHYSVLLGSAKPDGLPSELFASEQARWIGVQIEQQNEEPRTLLVSAPYALKAGDAETLGGLPPSAFLRATTEESTKPGSTPASGTGTAAVVAAVGNSRQAPAAAVTTSGGTANTIPMFTTATNIQNSILTQTGTVELNAAGTAAAGSAPILWLKNNATIQKGSTGNAIDIRFSPDKSGAVGTPNAFIRVQENGGGKNGTSIQFGTMPVGASGASERVRITANGLVGIGTAHPVSYLEVDSQSNTLTGGTIVGGNAADGSTQGGSTGLVVQGGNGDLTIDASGNGGAGLIARGGESTSIPGTGVIAEGGFGDITGEGGSGISAIGQGEPNGDGSGGFFSGGDGFAFGDGIDATAGSGVAGFFSGNVTVTGSISAGVKDFKIDHPLDPANKYLVHASVESSEMKNIYDGTITTDAQGNATVRLPSWFEALNTDFRYQLTVIGQFSQAIVARKVQNNEFVIRTSMPNVEVSWQLTGIRHDAYATANPLVVEEEKDARLKGYYIHPELYGAQAERQIEWARHPRMMKQMRVTQEAMKKRQAVKQ